MKQDKELLLKDICARLPYSVKVSVDNNTWCDFCKDIPYKITLENSYRILLGATLGYVKPYLFPLPSMTEEQEKEESSFDPFITEEVKTLCDWAVCLVDFYNKHHFDYHGLIEKGLAIDATGLNIY